MKASEDIFEEMKALFLEKTGVDIRTDCDMGVRMTACAAQLEALYVYNDWVMRQCFPQTAAGEYLDMHCAVRGITRKTAQCAVGELSFSVKTAGNRAIAIPEGTVCMTAAGISYVTTQAGEIAAGQLVGTVTAQALEPGEQGNAAALAVCTMAAPPMGVESCTNLTAFHGGKDAESDEALRARLLQSCRSLPNGANAAWYEKTVSAIDGVEAVSVMPRSRGLGTVDIIISSPEGMPSQELIAAVSEKLKQTREICVDIQVKEPEKLIMNISARVKTLAGYDPETVRDSVKAAIEGMFGGRMLGRSLFRAALGDVIYHVPGVENFELVSPDYDYTGDPKKLLVPGNITISEWR